MFFTVPSANGKFGTWQITKTLQSADHVVPGPGGLYLTQNKTNIWTILSGVPFTVSDDIQNRMKGTPNEIPQVHPLSRSGVIKCVLRDRLMMLIKRHGTVFENTKQ